jgi:acyl dehydratase
MIALSHDMVSIGDTLPPLSLPPLTRTTLALYAGASGDHNPMHIDIDFARAAGMPDVFAHGMLSMAWLGRLLTNWAPQRDLREFSVRFSALTHVGERIVCTGRVTEKVDCDGERRIRVAVATANEAGEVKLSGDALIAVR